MPVQLRPTPQTCSPRLPRSFALFCVGGASAARAARASRATGRMADDRSSDGAGAFARAAALRALQRSRRPSAHACVALTPRHACATHAGPSTRTVLLSGACSGAAGERCAGAAEQTRTRERGELTPCCRCSVRACVSLGCALAARSRAQASSRASSRTRWTPSRRACRCRPPCDSRCVPCGGAGAALPALCCPRGGRTKRLRLASRCAPQNVAGGAAWAPLPYASTADAVAKVLRAEGLTGFYRCALRTHTHPNASHLVS
jgi:hypothetical protein